MPRVVAYMDDLFFQMKLAETAKHLHIEVKVAASPDALLQLMDPLPKLVIVDRNARNMPLQAVRQLREQQPTLPIIGFLSHVQTELAAQADRKSTRLNSSHQIISYAVFCLKKKKIRSPA